MVLVLAVAVASVSIAFATGWLRDAPDRAEVADRPPVTTAGSARSDRVPTQTRSRPEPMTRSRPTRLRVPAIIVGHVRYGRPGVFARLGEMRRGEEIRVSRADGTLATFRVTRVASFAKSDFPTEDVYGDIPHAGLRLITCGGYDATTDEFEENVVVFAELLGA